MLDLVIVPRDISREDNLVLLTDTNNCSCNKLQFSYGRRLFYCFNISPYDVILDVKALRRGEVGVNNVAVLTLYVTVVLENLHVATFLQMA